MGTNGMVNYFLKFMDRGGDGDENENGDKLDYRVQLLLCAANPIGN